MRFLIFADLHQFDTSLVDKIDAQFDAMFFLGDINAVAIRHILNAFPDKPAYGLLGNHDNEGLFESVNNYLKIEREILGTNLAFPIKDINLEKIVFGDLSFCGLEGCVKYHKNSIGYTQKEALTLKIPKANILFSHETGSGFPCCENDIIHIGYKAVTRYVKRQCPNYHIFGHHHQNIAFKIKNTQCYCVFGCSVFDTDTGTMWKIF